MTTQRNWIRSPLSLRSSIGLAVGAYLLLCGAPMAQDELETAGRMYVPTDLGYSRAVVTRGGDMVWVSGTPGPRDADGQPITDFRGQARQALRNLDATLRALGSDLSDVVNITVMLRDPRHYEAYAEVRREFFTEGKYPAGAIFADVSFVNPDYLILLQAVAVVAR